MTQKFNKCAGTNPLRVKRIDCCFNAAVIWSNTWPGLKSFRTINTLFKWRVFRNRSTTSRPSGTTFFGVRAFRRRPKLRQLLTSGTRLELVPHSSAELWDCEKSSPATPGLEWRDAISCCNCDDNDE